VRRPLKKCTTFEGLLAALKFAPDRNASELMKKQVAFRPIENFESSICDYRESMTMDQVFEGSRSPQSRKNITFSYSNKDLNFNSSCGGKKMADGKRSSIQIDPSQLNLSAQGGRSNECSAFTVGVKPSPASMKAIQPFVRTGAKKKSCFHTNDFFLSKEFFQPKEKESIKSTEEKAGGKGRKVEEHYSNTTHSSMCRKEIPTF
jgi:hypothetical protein